MKKQVYQIVLMFFGVLLIHHADAQAPWSTNRVAKGKLSAPELNEVSGLIASRVNPGYFWVHNDSGDEARVFLIDSLARLVQVVNLEGITAIDLEDIAWVERNGKSYLVLADIGDNRAKRSAIKLYIFEEPKWSTEAKKKMLIEKHAIQTIQLNYEGAPRDAEAIFIDPLNKHFYLISKREFHSALYTAPIFQGGNRFTLRKQMEFPFTFVTAADISPNGREILIKNLTTIYYWEKSPEESMVKSLSKPFQLLKYDPEPQGEAISFDWEGKSFFTVSERPFGLDAYLYQYKISKPIH